MAVETLALWVGMGMLVGLQRGPSSVPVSLFEWSGVGAGDVPSAVPQELPRHRD